MVFKTNKVKFFQLRLKKITSKNLIKISKKIKKITRKNKVKFLINDKPLIAKKIGADGCHIGQKDMNYKKSRKILGKNKIIGITKDPENDDASSANANWHVMWNEHVKFSSTGITGT